MSGSREIRRLSNAVQIPQNIHTLFLLVPHTTRVVQVRTQSDNISDNENEDEDDDEDDDRDGSGGNNHDGRGPGPHNNHNNHNNNNNNNNNNNHGNHNNKNSERPNKDIDDDDFDMNYDLQDSSQPLSIEPPHPQSFKKQKLNNGTAREMTPPTAPIVSTREVHNFLKMIDALHVQGLKLLVKWLPKCVKYETKAGDIKRICVSLSIYMVKLTDTQGHNQNQNKNKNIALENIANEVFVISECIHHLVKFAPGCIGNSDIFNLLNKLIKLISYSITNMNVNLCNKYVKMCKYVLSPIISYCAEFECANNKFSISYAIEQVCLSCSDISSIQKLLWLYLIACWAYEVSKLIFAIKERENLKFSDCVDGYECNMNSLYYLVSIVFELIHIKDYQPLFESTKMNVIEQIFAYIIGFHKNDYKNLLKLHLNKDKMKYLSIMIKNKSIIKALRRCVTGGCEVVTDKMPANKCLSKTKKRKKKDIDKSLVDSNTARDERRVTRVRKKSTKKSSPRRTYLDIDNYDEELAIAIENKKKLQKLKTIDTLEDMVEMNNGTTECYSRTMGIQYKIWGRRQLYEDCIERKKKADLKEFAWDSKNKFIMCLIKPCKHVFFRNGFVKRVINQKFSNHLRDFHKAEEK